MVASTWLKITQVSQVGEFELANIEKLSPSAFAELHRRHVDSVYRHILACVSDVAQDVAP
jgi:hypothetical protein